MRASAPFVVVVAPAGGAGGGGGGGAAFDRPTLSAAAGAAARRHFSMDKRFLPHLSLLYGEFSPEVAEPLLTGAPPRAHPLRVSTLAVVRTEGSVLDWNELGSFPLG